MLRFEIVCMLVLRDQAKQNAVYVARLILFCDTDQLSVGITGQIIKAAAA